MKREGFKFKVEAFASESENLKFKVKFSPGMYVYYYRTYKKAVSGLSVCLVFYYPPDPIRGGPPRAALSGGGLAQTPHSAHPYKELRPPGFLIRKTNIGKGVKRHRSGL